MNLQQWNKHLGHIDEHISWPATKKEIVDACEGTDVDEDVLEEIKMKLPSGDKKFTKEEFKNMLMSEMSHKQM